MVTKHPLIISCALSLAISFCATAQTDNSAIQEKNQHSVKNIHSIQKVASLN